jgi:hypothetical protein
MSSFYNHKESREKHEQRIKKNKEQAALDFELKKQRFAEHV